jgi:precorrin-6Y C5,15-methyltransferase (decarboxylating)
MEKIQVIGLGVEPDNLPPNILSPIQQADVLVGGTRLLECFPDHPAEKIHVKSPLDRVIQRMEGERDAGKRIVVLAEGDPGFFGIGRKIIEAFGGEDVTLHPNITTLQAACARLHKTWEDVRTVSLHGRQNLWPLLQCLSRHDWVAIYTDQEYHPGRIAQELLDRRIDSFRMHVFEQVGLEGEKIRSMNLQDAPAQAFSSLNFVLLERMTKPDDCPRLGLPDQVFEHEKGLITKKEVRAVGLSLLEIEPRHVLWDLGAGCGSVGIEASVLTRDGMVYAVEKKPDRVKMIQNNKNKLGAYGVEIVEGEMPACLAEIPDPDRIFMGGGLARDVRLLEEACYRLKSGGKIVVHLVLMGSLARVREYILGLGWSWTVTQVQICRSRSLVGDQRLEPLNPVFVLKAEKPN